MKKISIQSIRYVDGGCYYTVKINNRRYLRLFLFAKKYKHAIHTLRLVDKYKQNQH